MMDDVVVCPLCIHFQPETPGDHFVVSPCGHLFHNQCIQGYLNLGNSKCPSCGSLVVSKRLTKIYGIDMGPTSTKATNSNLRYFSPELGQDPKKGTSKKEKRGYVFKVALLGSSGVGKSCILKRFAEDVFVPNINATRGVDLVRKTVQIGETPVELIIWDTVGQEVFNSIVSMCVREVQAIMFVYDVTKPQTLRDVQHWIKFAEENCPKDCVKLLVGNQIDLHDKRQVATCEGKAIADRHNFPFYETSAKNADNVEVAFRTLSAMVLENEWIMAAVQQKMRDCELIRIRSDDDDGSSGCFSWIRKSWQSFWHTLRNA